VPAAVCDPGPGSTSLSWRDAGLREPSAATAAFVSSQSPILRSDKERRWRTTAGPSAGTSMIVFLSAAAATVSTESQKQSPAREFDPREIVLCPCNVLLQDFLEPDRARAAQSCRWRRRKPCPGYLGLAIQRRTSSARHAVIPCDSRTGAGNPPVLTRRQSVVRENGTKCRSSFCRTKPVSGKVNDSALFGRTGSS
jgi:hypothetical protein